MGVYWHRRGCCIAQSASRGAAWPRKKAETITGNNTVQFRSPALAAA